MPMFCASALRSGAPVSQAVSAAKAKSPPSQQKHASTPAKVEHSAFIGRYGRMAHVKKFYR
jgi:hypothetical protein